MATGRDDAKRRVLGASGILNDLERYWFIGSGDDGNAWFNDAGFFCGDAGEGIAEPFLMIVLDVGDDAGERSNDVGGIKTPAETGFPDNEVAFLFGEVEEGHDGDDFEEGGVGSGRGRIGLMD